MKTPLYLLAALLACAATVLLGVWWDSRQTSSRRLAAWESDHRDLSLDAALDRPIRLRQKALTLDEGLALVSQQVGLPIELDPADRPDVHATQLPTDLRNCFLLPPGEYSARTVLRELLRPWDLGFEIRGGRIHIAGPDQLTESELRLVVYPLPLQFPKVNADEWVNLITRVVAPHSWKQVGGTGYLEVTPAALAIVQSSSLHEQIRLLLEALAEAAERPESLAPLPISSYRPTAQELRITAALDSPSELHCTERPLREVAADLSRRHGIPIALDNGNRLGVEITPDSPITADLRGVSLRGLLKIILAKLELTFTLRSECVLITPPYDAQQQELVVAYPVHDLIDGGPEGDFGPLIELITSVVAPQAWGFSGPTPEFNFGDRWLIIPQTADVHEQIADFLTKLRRGLNPAEANRLCPLTTAEKNVQRIEAALDRPLVLDFDDVSLAAFAITLQSQLGVPVAVGNDPFGNFVRDPFAAPDAPAPRISAHLAVGPARSRLATLLWPLGLDFTIRDEVLHIESRDAATDVFDLRLYDLRGLVLQDLPAKQIRHILMHMVAPQTWDNVGGPGTIGECRGLLVVVNEPSIHDQVTRVLQAIRANCVPAHPNQKQPWVISIEPDPERDRLESLLHQCVAVDFCSVPLDLALDQLAQKFDLPLKIDRAQDGRERPFHWPPVNLAVQSMTLGGVLDALLRPHGLDYAIRGGTISIGNRDAAAVLDTRLYHIPAPPDGLLESLDRTQNPFDDSTWDHPLGEGAARQIVGDWFLFCATWQTHQRLTVHFADLRTGRSSQRAVDWQAIDRELALQEVARLHWQATIDDQAEARRQLEVNESFKLPGPPPTASNANRNEGPP